MVGNVRARDFYSDTDKYFKQALENLNDLSFVGITEQFQQSAFILCQTFGWQKWYYMPQNVNKSRDEIKIIKSNFKQQIAGLNELDQELYNRGLELFNKQSANAKIPVAKKYKAITLGYLKQFLKA